MRLALFQPDMAPNTGAMMRLCACFGVSLDIIEPCGFVFDDRKLRRAGMDYLDLLDYKRHPGWPDFLNQKGAARVVLLTTKAEQAYYDFAFRTDDILMVGSESAGVPFDIHQSVEARVTIPMKPPARSLNVGMAAAIVLAEALRQTGQMK